LGFNMSWIVVDGIDQNALYDALDLAPTGETPDRYDLGTSRVPLAGATLKSGWCAVFANGTLVMDVTTGTNPPRLMRLPAKSRSITCVVLEGPMVSYASLWQAAATPGKSSTTGVMESGIWKRPGICLRSSQVFATLQWTSSEAKRKAAGRANGASTMCSTCRSIRRR